MTSTKDHIVKFQKLLRELFQFDCAELDFGIYRIMNHKRDVLEQFINEKLPNLVDTDLEQGVLFQQDQANKALDESREKVIEQLGGDAIDGDGELVEAYRGTPVGKAYLDAKATAASGRSRPAVEIDIYNHLYAFFSRYYQEGDFISKRRYSRNQRYAIPYNGEEVYLHWANSDQYYIKTAEHFNNYDWTAPYDVTVHFRLQAADVEQDNVKGEKRFFLPLITETKWDSSTREVTIPFEYRPLTLEESNEYKKTNQQEKIITAAIDAIPEQLGNAHEALAALMDEKPQNSDSEPITFLEYHLRQYTKRNTSDFFIHKDLKGFLTRELDFYLKNEVLNLGEMAATSEDSLKGWFQMMQLIQSVGSQIIDFLDQIEAFQKMLWEKRKFIIETQYCITVGNIDESFHADIVACEAQWAEWKELFDIDKEIDRVAFLKAHPTLVLDTRHFDHNFIDLLLASFDELDEMTDALLIHSENYQALNLLIEKYREQVKCVHIDPPYNTQTSGFLYKNEYQHSSWLAMMNCHICVVLELLNSEGSFLCHIDENEYERLHLLFEYHFTIPNAGTVIWDKRNPMTAGGGVATQHEYVIWRVRTDKPINLRNNVIQMMLNKANELISTYGSVTESTKKEYANWVTKNGQLSGGEKAYRFLDDNGHIYRGVSLRAPEPRTDPKFFQPLIHPVTAKPCPVPPNGFSRTPETLQKMIERGEIIFGYDDSTQPQQKRFLTAESTKQISSIVQNARRGKADLDALGLANFPYCHSVHFYEELLGAASDSSIDVIIDYFAGSGTTGQAVINLNREDDGWRKFILVEMGEYFNTVLLPRIKKITFTPEWKDGKPKRMATPEEAQQSPRIIKYIRLESYEDALNNIEFNDSTEQLKLQERIDDYLLKYMLKWETKRSQTLLNVEKLTSPFTYRLRIHVNGEIQERIADIPETFNYLLGLNVSIRKVYEDDGRRYLVYRGETREAPGQEIAVIWRETKGWTPSDFERDRKFVTEQKLIQDVDTIYVNGDSCIPNAKAVEPIFKARMFA